MNKTTEALKLADEVLARFTYTDGILYWKRTGKPAGSKTPTGYLRVMLDKKSHYVHRLIYAMHHRELPEFVDHINGVKADNRLENLRACTMEENNRNVGVRKTNSSGVKNVHFDKMLWKYRVKIRCGGKQLEFGSYDNLKDAEAAAKNARLQLHKEFTNHG